MKLNDANKAGITEGAGVRGHRTRRQKIEADADEGKKLLGELTYIDALDKILAIIQQLEDRYSTTIKRPQILDMVVAEGGYKNAAKHAQDVLDHLQQTSEILARTDEPVEGASADLAPDTVQNGRG